jgi:hypothetical protein
MKNLCAVINDPDQVENYLNYLKEMGNSLSRNLHLLHIENPTEYHLRAPDITGVATVKLQMNLKQKTDLDIDNIDRLVRELNQGAGQKMRIDFSSQTGDILTILNRYISGLDDCMVVLRNRGKSSLWDPANHDIKVIQHIERPVWILPDDAEFQYYDEIVYATDYNQEDIPTMQKLIRLTRRFSPNITALHISTDDDFMARVARTGYQEMIREKTSYERISVKVLQEKEPYDMGLLVNDFSTLISAKLIVVLKENKHFLGRIFNPDSSLKIIRQAGIPVLVFHEPK